MKEFASGIRAQEIVQYNSAGAIVDPATPLAEGGTVNVVAGDGDPADFSGECVGAHSSGSNISSKATLAKPTGATHLLIQAVTKNACFTLDGTDPEAAKGFVLYAGDPPIAIPVPGAGVEIIQAEATCRLEYQWIK